MSTTEKKGRGRPPLGDKAKPDKVRASEYRARTRKGLELKNDLVRDLARENLDGLDPATTVKKLQRYIKEAQKIRPDLVH